MEGGFGVSGGARAEILAFWWRGTYTHSGETSSKSGSRKSKDPGSLTLKQSNLFKIHLNNFTGFWGFGVMFRFWVVLEIKTEEFDQNVFIYE